MARKSKEDDYCCDADDDDYEDYNSTDEDNVCQTDSEYGGVEDDGDEKPEECEKDYDFVTEDDVRRCQDEVTAEISDRLSVPRGFAAAFLRHCRWDAERLENEWFADERRVRGAVGLAAAGGLDGDVPTALNSLPLTCAICFDIYAPGEMRSAGCSHYYCHECWRGYIRAAVGNGARCLLLRCPGPGCTVPVVRELVDAAAAGEDRARYAMFVVRSFVEEGTSKYVRWCPGPGCTLAVRSESGSRLYEVTCKCKHVFCFRCGEDAHRPASCETTRAWVDKCRSDGETSSWVLANTKHCPECRRAIEKNQGCNHMTCGAPCYHQFCWLCLGSWADHSGNFFHCNRYAAAKSEFTEEKTRERQARASLERFLHYYERFTAHGASMKKAQEDLDSLRADGGGLYQLGDAIGVPPTELDFLLEAYARIVEARRVLRWTYAHVYHLDPARDNVEFYEYLQGEAEKSLERLHHCAEEERGLLKKDLYYYGAAIPAGYAAGKYMEFREKLCHLNLVTRNHFSTLVEGFESGMAEVVS
ncbi:hypothetical protein SEVIR_2G318200v4 [Setaria viridis]|uniref:RBR-type E3 ubiquitin transferase n=1 Tax=Setaria viridis TaxID=4556 RepID=A0A4U6VYJ6_SETVI|nr:probable E3 ubiquitin-protein ligase ARI8 [Setaria viridis]TKW34632.1 hypothetical protein SEVIR_2G318200v2 [Setaria viridis]